MKSPDDLFAAGRRGVVDQIRVVRQHVTDNVNDTNTSAVEKPSGGVSFGMVQRDIARDPTLPVLVKALYSVLATYANEDREAWPSQETLAADLGVTDRTVRKAVKLAREAKLIEVVHTQTSDRYTLRDMSVGGYVVGSGPQSPPGTSVPGEPERPFQAGRNGRSAEVDQRTRPETQTIDTSSDAASGAPRTSSRGDQRVRIFVPASYWKADAGEAMQTLTACSVAALQHHGYEADGHAVGAALKGAIDHASEDGGPGIDRELLRKQLESTLNLAAGRDPKWERLIRWPSDGNPFGPDPFGSGPWDDRRAS